MKQVSLRIIKRKGHCPDDLLRSITKCLEETLTHSCNHHQHIKIAQMEKLKILQKMIRQNLQAENPDYQMESFITEVGGSYFVSVKFYLNHDINGILFTRLQVTNKVTSLKDDCIETVGPLVSHLEESKMRELELPNVLIDQLLEYKENGDLERLSR